MSNDFIVVTFGPEFDIFIYMLKIIRISMEKEMAPHSSTLAWRIPGTEEPGGLQSMES